MSVINKEIIFRIVAILYIVVITFPLVVSITGINLPVVCIIVTTVCIVLYPSAMINRLFIWMLVYFAVLLLYVVLGKPITLPGLGDDISVYRQMTIEMAFYLPNVAIFSVMRYMGKKEVYNTIFLTALISLLLSFVYCFVLIQQDAYILRQNEAMEVRNVFRIPGTPSYSLMHAYILLLPVFIFAVKERRGFISILMLLCIALLIYIIVHTYITTTLLLTVVLVVFLVVYRYKNPLITIGLSMVFAVLIIMLYNNGILNSLMPGLNDFYSDTAVEAKLGDVGLENRTTSYLSGRERLHTISWNSFLSNPFVGGSDVGGHSNLLDRLGGMGLFCFIPYIMILISAVKLTFRMYTNKRIKIYYLICLFCVLVLLYEKGIFNYEGWCFFLIFVPCGFLYFSNVQISHTKNDGAKIIE